MTTGRPGDTRTGTSGGPGRTGDDRVAAAFHAHPRTGFLPKDQHAHAHEDRPLPLTQGQTSSQPSTVATMLRLLDVPEGARVLDVGSGSGWTTALLSHLVGPTGRVEGVELVPELATWGEANLRRAGPPWARIRVAARGVLGLPDEAPFDRVLVSAQAAELPAALVDQLAVGGIAVLPVAGTMLRVVRTGGTTGTGGTEVSRHGGYRFVPLRED